MQLSPTVRAVLTVVGIFVGALAVILPTLGLPVWIGAILGAVTATLGYLGIVPPQVGGQQVGIANPTIVEPPAADVVEQPPVGGV